MVLGYFKFDRTTLFLYEQDNKSPNYILCMNSSRKIVPVNRIPIIPALKSRPVAVKDISGYWIPIQIKDYMLGCILVDNLYTLSDVSLNTINILTELCGLLALTLESLRLFNNFKSMPNLTILPASTIGVWAWNI